MTSDWPTEPADIIREALRDYVGDGEGADEEVLTAYEKTIREHIAQKIDEQAICVRDEWLTADEKIWNRAIDLAVLIARGESSD